MHNRNFSGSLPSNSKRPIQCVSLNNWSCEAKPTLVDINSNETLFYPCTVNVKKSGRRCNTVDDPHMLEFVFQNNMNAKVFNLLQGVNAWRFLVQHELYQCKYGLNGSVPNSKQKWNHYQCWSECKDF